MIRTDQSQGAPGSDRLGTMPISEAVSLIVGRHLRFHNSVALALMVIVLLSSATVIWMKSYDTIHVQRTLDVALSHAKGLLPAEESRKILESVRQELSKELIPNWAWQSAVFGTLALLVLALGLKRLENIDAQIAAGADALRRDLQDRINTLERYLEKNADTRMAQWFDKHSTERLSELSKEIQAQRDAIDRFSKQYQWLLDIAKQDRSVLNVRTVEQAHLSAQRARAAGDLETASALLQQIVSRRLMGNGDEFHNAAVEARRLGDDALTLQILEQGKALLPNNPDIVATYGQILSSNGRFVEAETAFAPLLRDEDMLRRYWRVLSFYADHLTYQNKTGAALTALRKRCELVPADPKSRTDLALHLEETAGPDAAVAELVVAVENAPAFTGAWYNLARIEFERGRFRSAKEYIDQAAVASAELQPGMTLERILNLKGAILEHLARSPDNESARCLAEAKECYRAVLRISHPGALEAQKSRERLLFFGEKLPDETNFQSLQAAQMLAEAITATLDKRGQTSVQDSGAGARK